MLGYESSIWKLFAIFKNMLNFIWCVPDVVMEMSILLAKVTRDDMFFITWKVSVDDACSCDIIVLSGLKLQPSSFLTNVNIEAYGNYLVHRNLKQKLCFL